MCLCYCDMYLRTCCCKGSDDESDQGDPGAVLSVPEFRIPNGLGVPLGYLHNVNDALNRYHVVDLKMLHLYLYGKLTRDSLLMLNIKKFKGYEYNTASRRHIHKFEETLRMDPHKLRIMCDMLDLDIEGGTRDQAFRLVEFLVKPESNSPYFRCVRTIESIAKTYHRVCVYRILNSILFKAVSDEDYESDAETMVACSEKTRDGSEYSEGSCVGSSECCRAICDISDSEKEAETKLMSDKDISSSIDDTTVISQQDESGFLASGETSVCDEKVAKPGIGLEVALPGYASARRLPTDDDVRRFLQKILKGLNLEKITMNTICRAVYSQFPDYDLVNKRDFITATVKSLL
ncbi:unnamed protein product [Danaus chrysippus]|uniref:(African queen) hypothetical protein n=1 Tax=Danaus chrysippus TaxID=151541 RepID=A0A8J2QSQ9_9NEOP|nr:unnamed protein product [Danaus chrysippus]